MQERSSDRFFVLLMVGVVALAVLAVVVGVCVCVCVCAVAQTFILTFAMQRYLSAAAAVRPGANVARKKATAG